MNPGNARLFLVIHSSLFTLHSSLSIVLHYPLFFIIHYSLFIYKGKVTLPAPARVDI